MLTRRGRGWSLAVAIGVAAGWFFGSEGAARAFCRSRTCGKDCTYDDFNCPIEGEALFWKGRCVSYSLQRDELPTVTHDELEEATDSAFRAWQEVPCFAGQAPISMTVSHPFGVTACGRVEYNSRQANANIVVLRSTWDEDDASKVLGLTTVTYNIMTGEILDADIEINGMMPISGGHPGPGQYDLQSILTHEAGHFFGLTHSPVGAEDNCRDGATMCSSYDPGSEDFRTLEDDDVAGICTIYPPDRDATCDDSPLRGFSPECGLDPLKGGACAMRWPSAEGGARAFPLAIGLLALLLRRARRGDQKLK